MDQDEFVIFAELKREKFEEILQILNEQFKNIDHGRQGDDYIWIHFSEGRIEIDSFYSMNLELKGKRKQYTTAMQMLSHMDDDWVLQRFDPPKIDRTR